MTDIKTPDDDQKRRDSIVAFDYFRKKVEREDGIIASRLGSGLALQGLLLASCALILGNGVAKDAFQLEIVVETRRVFLFLIIIAGLLSSILTFLALLDASKALKAVRDKRKRDIAGNSVFYALPVFPHPETEGHYASASAFPHVSIAFFTMIWIGALIVFAVVVVGEKRVWLLTPTIINETGSVTAKGSDDQRLSNEHDISRVEVSASANSHEKPLAMYNCSRVTDNNIKVVARVIIPIHTENAPHVDRP